MKEYEGNELFENLLDVQFNISQIMSLLMRKEYKIVKIKKEDS